MDQSSCHRCISEHVQGEKLYALYCLREKTTLRFDALDPEGRDVRHQGNLVLSLLRDDPGPCFDTGGHCSMVECLKWQRYNVIEQVMLALRGVRETVSL